MKTKLKRLLGFLVAMIMVVGILPTTTFAANLPNTFYASLTPNGFGKISQGASALTYATTGTDPNRVIYGMESAGGVFFTVEGKVINGGRDDDGWRELRMYDSSLTNYRTIGTINQEGGNYWIIDTAMNTSGEAPELYGTYNFVYPEYSLAQSMICTINLETATTGNYLAVSGLPNMHIIYAIAFDKNGTMYAIGADAGDNGGPASLYTIDLTSRAATLVGAIKDASDNAISTNYCQDIAFDSATNTLYWAENDGQKIYTVDTTTAVATEVGAVKYAGQAQPLQNICIPDSTAFAQNMHMISVIYSGAGVVTGNDADKAFYMVDNGENITLNITPDEGGGLRSVKVDGESISLNDLTEYTFSNVMGNHVIEVDFKKAISIKQNTWNSKYDGTCYTALYYTENASNKFYKSSSAGSAPSNGYTQTLLDTDGNPIDSNTVIFPGNYAVRITHPGNDEYMVLDVIYEDALQLAKMNGTPGRPVVYGRVGCKQSELPAVSYIQEWYDDDGNLISAGIYDRIPVTLEWKEPEKVYNTPGIFFENPIIYAANELDERLIKCYDIDSSGTPLTAGCAIDQRSSQVVILAENESSLINLSSSNQSHGTVSGQGAYRKGTQVTVTAIANEGYTFKGWQEDGQTISTNAVYTFTAGSDRTLTALFDADANPTGYSVTITAGEGMSTTDNATQTGLSGAMTSVVYTADDLHYFPEDYYVASENGIYVTRDSYRQITVSGTPRATTTITLSAATAKVKESTPECTVNAINENTVIIGAFAYRYYYSIDGGANWTKFNTNYIAGVTPEYGVWIKDKTNYPNTMLDSDIQKITITKAATPEPTINYWNVRFDNLEGKGTFSITVDNTTETCTSNIFGRLKIKEAWLGKTVSIVRQGGGNVLYSTPKVVNLPARPTVAPTGITATHCTSESPYIGSINGVNDTMEISIKGADSWMGVPEGKTSVEHSYGEHEVRFKATDSSFASVSTYVTINEYLAPATYTVTFNANGASGTHTADTNVTSPYTLPTTTSFNEPIGKQFRGWSFTSNGAVITTATIELTEDTELFAIWDGLPKAAFSSNTDIVGVVNTALNGEIKFYLRDDSFLATPQINANVTDWFENMPTGLSAKVKSYDSAYKILTIEISGTPTQEKNEGIQIVIPGNKLNSNTPLTVINESGTGCKWKIGKNCTVAITAGANMTTTDNASQTGVTGIAITDVVYTADDGYYFPADHEEISSNGVSVERIDYTQIKVSGIPTDDVTITLPPAIAKTREATPNITVNADSKNSVEITAGSSPNMQYSVDGGLNWTPIGDSTEIYNVTTTHGILVKLPRTDPNTRLDSENQVIPITKAVTPNGNIDYINEKIVGLVASVHYAYIVDREVMPVSVTGVTELAIDDAWFGKTISLVTLGDNTVLFSETQEITVPQRPDAPTDITPEKAASSAASDGKLNNVTDAMEYKKRGEDVWHSITGTTVENLEPATYEIRYKSTLTAFASETANVTVSYRTSSGGGGGISKYAVKFDTDGGNTIANVSVARNSTVKQPAAPTKEGFKFDGWYTDKACTKAYDFTSKITSGITLYAKWVEEETKPTEPTEPTAPVTGEWKNPFGDVKESDWYYEAVKYVNENKLMNGTNTNTFSPDETLTRAMLVTILYRLENEPAVNKSIPFGDIKTDMYYANAVIWAHQNGIVNGVSETAFAPDNNISREQIAAIIYRYAVYKGMEAVTTAENLGFADSNDISEYAISAMNWAVGKGLIKGKSATTVNPLDNATRAEIATILQRFIEGNK